MISGQLSWLKRCHKIIFPEILSGWGLEDRMDDRWQQFMKTGRIEDYLSFKMQQKENLNQNSLKRDEEMKIRKEDKGAGYSKRDGYSAWQFPGR